MAENDFTNRTSGTNRRLAEQRRIMAKVKQPMALMDSLQTHLAASLDVAGKLLLQDPTDEPASALLKRIKSKRRQPSQR